MQKPECGIKTMEVREYGDPQADFILIQPADDHDLSGMEREAAAIRERTGAVFRFLAVKIDNWNRDLSPWCAPAVFGTDDFGNGAAETLEKIRTLCSDRTKTYFIGGYSLAALFALWAVYQTDVFAGAAAASPSVWFPGFTEYMKTHELKCGHVYLSLGTKEERTRNPVMSKVGDCIRDAYAAVKEAGAHCRLEWNPGNHFRDPDIRTAKAFAYLLEEYRGKEGGICTYKADS